MESHRDRASPDLRRSLAELHRLPRPSQRKTTSFRSGLVDRCERLLWTPLQNSGPEDFRVRLHQRFYREVPVPLVLPLLEENPLADGDLYDGDVLSSVLHQTGGFWQDSLALLARAQVVAGRALTRSGLPASVLSDIHTFQARTGSLSP